jgi:hypothetical protein
MRSRLICFLFLVWSAVAGAVESTALRIWTSQTGSKVSAKAVELTPNGMVKLVTQNGRELVLGIEELSEPDQALLKKHFAQPGVAPAGQQGTIEGPLKADADTTYFVFRPKDLNPQLKSPVMIWTQSEGARRETLERFQEAADLIGMIIATPVEARYEGTVTLLNNSAHTRDVLAKIKSDFRIQPSAIHFGGDKSGGAAAFNHSIRWKSAGTFTVSGYFEREMKAVNEGYHYLAGQTNSSSRYRTAWTAARFGDQATHQFFEGTREMPDSRKITIGMVWMYTRSLYENLSSRSQEASQFEQRFLPWLKELAQSSPGEAAYLTELFTDEVRLKGHFKEEVAKLHASLARDSAAVAHVKGSEALDRFSEKEMARYGNHFSPLTNHAPAGYQRQLERLAAKYQEAEELKPVFKRLAEPTHQ